ncbi:MAG: hypothetical protein AB8B48_21250, partial [Pseudomonadales bacterium]
MLTALLMQQERTIQSVVIMGVANNIIAPMTDSATYAVLNNPAHGAAARLRRMSSMIVVITMCSFNAYAKESSDLASLQSSEVIETDEFLAASPKERLKRYQAEIQTLQSQYGAYNPQLSEALQGLGEAQQQMGDHPEAIKTFSQSAHIRRINDGLFTPSILPLLENMVESYAHLGDWEAVDDQHHFMMEINGQSFGWSDERMLPVLDKLTRWHMYAFFEDVTPQPVHHLQMARSLFAAASRVIELNFGETDLRLAKQLRGRRVADFYLAHIMQQEAEDQRRLEQLHNIGGRERDHSFSQGTRLVSQGYLSGLRSSRQVVKIYQHNEEVGPRAQAEAILELGDWYLRFNKRQSAIKSYTQAYELLSSDNERIKIRDELFTSPAVLDFAADYSDYLDPIGPGMAKGYVLLELDLSKTGSVSRANFVEEQPTTPSKRRAAMRELKGRRFRPRFEDGVPVATEGM